MVCLRTSPALVTYTLAKLHITNTLTATFLRTFLNVASMPRVFPVTGTHSVNTDAVAGAFQI